MLQSFSDYLEHSRSDHDANLETTKYFARIWFNSVCRSIAQLKAYFPPATLESLLRGRLSGNYFEVESELEKLLEKADSTAALKSVLDHYFSQLMLHLSNVATTYLVNQLPNPRKNFYPFEAAISGVGICCRLIDADGEVVLNFREPVHSAVGSNDARSIAAKLRGSLPSARQLDDVMRAKFGRSLSKNVDLAAPHAEDLFFTCYFNELVEAILKFNQQLKNEYAGNALALSFLAGARIEFVISTSPCRACQDYFIALRHRLNELNIRIPIVIFADSQCNAKGDRDGAIFVVDYAAKYCVLPFSWASPKVLKKREAQVKALSLERYIERSPTSTALNDKYSALLILSVFGEVFLPRLAGSPHGMVQSFIQSMLSTSTTSDAMVDWVRFYFTRVMDMQSHDYSGTRVEVLNDDGLYVEVDPIFLRRFREIPGLSGFIQYVTQVAATKDNAMQFFLCIVQMWHSLFNDHLSLTPHDDITRLKVRKPVAELAGFVRHVMFWDEETAPPEVLHHFALPGEPEYCVVANPRVSELCFNVSRISSVMHYIAINDFYRENVLNSIVTRSDFALEGGNHTYDDHAISILIYKLRMGISQLACKEGGWDLAVLERIFNALSEGRLDPELQAIIQSLPEPLPGQFRELQRVFSQDQVAAELGFSL